MECEAGQKNNKHMKEISLLPSQTLYQVLTAGFCVLVVVSNIISAKLIELPGLRGLSVPAGLVVYPLTFLLTDLVTELYEAKKARVMVYLALALSVLSYAIIMLALYLPTRDIHQQEAFQAVLGLNGIIVFASLTAYLMSQLMDIQLYSWIKKRTGPRFIWLRTNGSTLASQVVDCLAVNLIHLYWGLGLSFQDVWPIIIFSYSYKAFFSVVNTPLFYSCLFIIKRYADPYLSFNLVKQTLGQQLQPEQFKKA